MKLEKFARSQHVMSCCSVCVSNRFRYCCNVRMTAIVVLRNLAADLSTLSARLCTQAGREVYARADQACSVMHQSMNVGPLCWNENCVSRYMRTSPTHTHTCWTRPHSRTASLRATRTSLSHVLVPRINYEDERNCAAFADNFLRLLFTLTHRVSDLTDTSACSSCSCSPHS